MSGQRERGHRCDVDEFEFYSPLRNQRNRMSTSARFTVGKLDAGMAILLTDDNFLVEFPSLLLPTSISPGCIVNISVLRDPQAERARHFRFQNLQQQFLQNYGTTYPDAPRVSVRGVQATSVTLEWEKLNPANATVHSIEVWRDGSLRMKAIKPKRGESLPTWTRIGGLEVDKEYTFHVRLRTSAGTYDSQPVLIRTLTLDNLSAIHVTFGLFESPTERREALENLQPCLERFGAKWDASGHVTLDTTHVVAGIGRGPAVEKAKEWNIPVVRPEWVFACESKKRIQPAGAFYLKGVERQGSVSVAQSTETKTEVPGSSGPSQNIADL